jgi:Rad3-related DNA helicase
VVIPTGRKAEILAALINKIEEYEKSKVENQISLSPNDLLPNDLLPNDLSSNDLSSNEFEKLTSIMADLNSMMKDQGFDLAKLMQEGKDISSNKNILKDIIKDVKDNITKNGDDIDNLFESTKEIGKKYEEKISTGELTLNELVSSMMGIISNPNDLKETFEDIDPKKLPNPEKIINKMMSELGHSNLPKSGEMNNLMNSLINGQKTDFNPMKLLDTIMTDMKKIDCEDPLTSDQLKEMEEFYSKINLGE